MFSIFTFGVKLSSPSFGAISSTIRFFSQTISKYSDTGASQIQAITHIPTRPISLNYHRIGLKIPATAAQGICYEHNIGKSLRCMFPGAVLDEVQIAHLLAKFTGRNNLSKLRGIDFTILDTVPQRIYVVQVKIGARTRTVNDIGTFLNTVKVFKKYVAFKFSKYEVVPIWYSSADLKHDAKQVLKSSGVQVFVESEWNIDPDKCRLFINFTNVLRTGKILIEDENSIEL